MIRYLLALLLLCSVAEAQTVTRQGSPSMLFGSGAPPTSQGIPNQVYYDTANHKMWRRTASGWTQLGIFNSPTDADITAIAVPSLLNGFYLGSNYDGMEGGASPGTVYFDYQPPNLAHFDYLVSRGIRIIRLPILWERLQPTLNQPLNVAYLGYITTAANYAATKGMGLIVDLHNYGAYNNNPIGSSQTPISALVDVWSRLAQALYNQPGVIGYDVMNEPRGDGTYLQQYMQAAVNAIRAYDTTKPILIEGNGYSSAGTWTGYPENNSYAIADPSNKIIYEAHNYLDCDSSGTHSNWSIQSTDPSQAEPGGTTCVSSQTVTVNTGLQRVTPFVQWCQQRGYQCMIGEVGAGTDPHWLTSLDKELTYLRANNVGVTYFAAGATFQTYMYNVNPQLPGQQPGNLVDTPQMGVLMKYSGFTAVPYSLYGPRSGSQGAPAMFHITTNGYIASSVTITPNDNGAGGTFSPISVTLSAGFGGSATFTYTAAGSTTYSISATSSNPAWINPAPIGFSTQPDLLATIAAGSGATPINILSTNAINTSYLGPVLTLRRASDNATQSFGYISTGVIDTAAISAWANGSTVYLHNLVDTAPGVTGSLQPVATTADEPVWSATALNGHPAYTLNNSRLTAASNISGKAAVTVVATVSISGGNQCNRLLAWENANRWIVPGSGTGWWENDFDSPVSVGTIDTATPHVLVMRWQGTGTGTAKRDLFVDGRKVSSTPATAAATGPDLSNQLRMGFFQFYTPCSTNGVVGDVMVFNGTLSDAEVMAATSYEKAKFGL